VDFDGRHFEQFAIPGASRQRRPALDLGSGPRHLAGCGSCRIQGSSRGFIATADKSRSEDRSPVVTPQRDARRVAVGVDVEVGRRANRRARAALRFHGPRPPAFVTRRAHGDQPACCRAGDARIKDQPSVHVGSRLRENDGDCRRSRGRRAWFGKAGRRCDAERAAAGSGSLAGGRGGGAGAALPT